MTDAEQLETWLHRAPTERELHDFIERVGVKVDSGINETDARKQAIEGK